MFTATWTPEYPDNAPHVGKTVVFVPNPEVFLGEDGSTTLGAVEGVIDTAGALKAKDGTTALLLKWKPGLQYQVRLVGSGLHPFWFDVPAVDGGTLDLSTVVPSPGAALVPTQYAELDARIDVLEAAPPGSAPDATTTSKGVVQLAGDLGGTAAAPTVPGLAGKSDTSHNHTGVYAPVLGADDNYVTDAEKAALHAHANKAALDLVSGTNTGDQVLGRYVGVNAQTGTTYTPVLTDEGKLVTLTNAAAITVTLPQDSALAFPVGGRIDFAGMGAGLATFVAGTGATVNGTPSLVQRAQYGAFTAIKVAANTWLVVGDLA